MALGTDGGDTKVVSCRTRREMAVVGGESPRGAGERGGGEGSCRRRPATAARTSFFDLVAIA